jgi:voltage-gated potassium channel
MIKRLRAKLRSPFLARLMFHLRHANSKLNRKMVLSLLAGIAAVVVLATTAITALERSITIESFGRSLYWASLTVIGKGDASYVTSTGGLVVSWLLVLFGVAMVTTFTGALVALAIDFLLKEGLGMGASGYHDHVVVCGWNATARDLVNELKSDDQDCKIVVVHDAERNPAGHSAYYVRGDATSAADLERAGVAHARAVLIFPLTSANEDDMRSILCTLAVRTVSSQVRTVVEVNNPAHIEHLRRAQADEIISTSQLTAHMLARASLYPGLAQLLTDIVCGGEGSELYRVALPTNAIGMSTDELSLLLRREHRATLVSITRDGVSFTNPPCDFSVRAGDDAVVIAEGLNGLEPVIQQRETPDLDLMVPAQRSRAYSLSGVAQQK